MIRRRGPRRRNELASGASCLGDAGGGRTSVVVPGAGRARHCGRRATGAVASLCAVSARGRSRSRTGSGLDLPGGAGVRIQALGLIGPAGKLARGTGGAHAVLAGGRRVADAAARLTIGPRRALCEIGRGGEGTARATSALDEAPIHPVGSGGTGAAASVTGGALRLQGRAHLIRIAELDIVDAADGRARGLPFATDHDGLAEALARSLPGITALTGWARAVALPNPGFAQ